MGKQKKAINVLKFREKIEIGKNIKFGDEMQGHDRGEEGGKLGEFWHGEEEGSEVVNVWRGKLREGDTYGKRKQMWENEK